MEINELKNLWSNCDAKLDQVLCLHYENLKEVKTSRVRSNLRMFTAMTVFGLLSAVAWMVFLGYLVYQLRDFTAFVISAGGVMLITFIGIINYIRQLEMAANFDYTEEISVAQEKLNLLKLSLIKSIRIGFLQAPFYSTFYLSSEMLKNGNLLFLVLTILVTLALAAAGIWLYVSLNVKNMHIKWVRIMLDSVGLRSLNKAADFLNEIETFKQA